MKYLIIGAVAGGATAATRIRRNDENAEIIIFEKGPYISYANCGLPYYIGDTIKDRNNLIIETPKGFANKFKIDARIENEAISINPEDKTVEVRKNDGTTYVEGYDKLLLSPGSYPFVPSIDGVNKEGVFTLRNITDTDIIKEYINKHRAKKAIIIGAGFIGLEMAENFQNLGIDVDIVELSNQVMGPIDFTMAQFMHQYLKDKGVGLFLEDSLAKIERVNSSLKATLKSGKEINTDLILLSIGVRANIKLAQDAGLKIGDAHGIWVDEFLQTSVPDIYAVGDAIEYPHPLTGKPWLNYLANPANRQGRIVADNMVFGNKTKYEGAIGTAIAKVFDKTIGVTGLPVKKLNQLGIKNQYSYNISNDHAGYYPDSTPMLIQLAYSPDNGKIYGAQIIGYDGVSKRIDEISLIIKNNGTIQDLMQLEQAYAPPFSSAKDAIAISGYVANNVVSGRMPIIHWQDMQNAIGNEDYYILDVRTQDEVQLGAISGSINIPFQELYTRYNELPYNKTIYIYCASGHRGYLAQQILKSKGFNNTFNLTGGYKIYSIAVMRFLPPNQDSSVPSGHLSTYDNSNLVTLNVNACGLSCPGPIVKLKQAVDTLKDGEIVKVESTDPGFMRDAGAWCHSTGNKLLSKAEDKGIFTVMIEKVNNISPQISVDNAGGNKGKTFIMFSDDLDKALATFILANGAAATGAKTSIFFTFWGLNVIKKGYKAKVEKDFLGKMFSLMLPPDSKKLHLSKMNMFGLGGKMMRYIMKKKNIASLEELRTQSIAQGVEFIACQMSMDVMGIKKEELLDNITIGGVATYMDRADGSNVNLFI